MRWLLVSIFLNLPPSSSLAATFLVDNTADLVDAALGDGLCAALDGSCTLRAAVIESNQTDDEDDIVVPAGAYSLTGGRLDATEELSITGAGPSLTTIDGNGSEAAFGSGRALSLTGLTIHGAAVG